MSLYYLILFTKEYILQKNTIYTSKNTFTCFLEISQKTHTGLCFFLQNKYLHECSPESFTNNIYNCIHKNYNIDPFVNSDTNFGIIYISFLAKRIYGDDKKRFARVLLLNYLIQKQLLLGPVVIVVQSLPSREIKTKTDQNIVCV